MGPKGILSLLQGLGRQLRYGYHLGKSKLGKEAPIPEEGKKLLDELSAEFDTIEKRKAKLKTLPRRNIPDAEGFFGEVTTKAADELDNLIAKGLIEPSQRKQMLEKTHNYILRKFNTIPLAPVDVAQTEKLIKEALKFALTGGAVGAAGYYAGTRSEEEAVEEMEEATQIGPVPGYFKNIGFDEDWKEEGNWGKPVANLLMDIISPIPKYTNINNGRE